MRKILLGILISCLFFPGLPVHAQTDEGYGEAETSLGQFVDSFEDLGNVSVRYRVERNVTLDAMELNFTASGPHDNETFTDYTTVDNNNRIEVFADRIEFVNLRRDDEAWVYFDYGGVDYWDDFEVEFTVVINDTEGGDADQRWIAFVFTLNNYTGDFNSRPALHESLFVSIRDDAANDNNFKFSVSGYENAILIGEDIGKIRAVSNNEMYLRVNRTADNFYLWVYTDSTYSTLDESLNLTAMGLTEPLRYIYGLQSLDILNDGQIWMSGYVKDLWLGNLTSGYAVDGYFTTENYLSDPLANGSVLVQMTNSSIPANTAITVEFSVDNATWVDASGAAGSESLTGGFESIDLRDLNYSTVYHVRFNLSQTGGFTPRLYQSRLITTQGQVGAGVGGGVNRPTMLVVGGLITIVIAVVIGVKKR